MFLLKTKPSVPKHQATVLVLKHTSPARDGAVEALANNALVGKTANRVKAAIATLKLIGKRARPCLQRALGLVVPPGRSQDLYEQSFADGVDFLKGIPHNGACPAASVHIIACDYLPLMSHTTWELKFHYSLK